MSGILTNFFFFNTFQEASRKELQYAIWYAVIEKNWVGAELVEP